MLGDLPAPVGLFIVIALIVFVGWMLYEGVYLLRLIAAEKDRPSQAEWDAVRARIDLSMVDLHAELTVNRAVEAEHELPLSCEVALGLLGKNKNVQILVPGAVPFLGEIECISPVALDEVPCVLFGMLRPGDDGEPLGYCRRVFTVEQVEAFTFKETEAGWLFEPPKRNV